MPLPKTVKFSSFCPNVPTFLNTTLPAATLTLKLSRLGFVTTISLKNVISLPPLVANAISVANVTCELYV